MWLNLIVAGCLCCLPAQERVVDANSEVTLSETQPVARIQLPANIRAAPAPIVEVPIVSISNAQGMSFSIFAYLEWARSASGSSTRERVLLGNFTVYPPDQAGSYMLRASTAFEKLKAMGADTGRDQVVVLVEMKRTNPKQPWSSVQVVIAPLRWRSENS